MGKPTTLPGIIGSMASILGVAGLAESIGTNPRTLHHWAHNTSAMPAIEADRLAELCREHEIKPQLYTHPGMPTAYVASTPQGWIMWGVEGYAKRRRYMGHVAGMVPAGPDILLCARTHGWPL